MQACVQRVERISDEERSHEPDEVNAQEVDPPHEVGNHQDNVERKERGEPPGRRFFDKGGGAFRRRALNAFPIAPQTVHPTTMPVCAWPYGGHTSGAVERCSRLDDFRSGTPGRIRTCDLLLRNYLRRYRIKLYRNSSRSISRCNQQKRSSQ